MALNICYHSVSQIQQYSALLWQKEATNKITQIWESDILDWTYHILLPLHFLVQKHSSC